MLILLFFGFSCHGKMQKYTSDFAKLDSDETVEAQIVVVRQDSKGKIYGHISNPEEKVSGKTFHKIVMIVMQ